MNSQLDAITAALTDLHQTFAEKDERLGRIGACMDDPTEPTIIVRVRHGKILDIATTDAATALPPHELQDLLNAVILGAYVDWYDQVARAA